MKNPWWDDGDIDPGIRPVVEALNRLPGVKTFESCEGHGEHPCSFVLFSYKKGKEVPPWAEQVLKAALNTGACLGCLNLKLKAEYRFDCSHDFKKAWWLKMFPRHDYSKTGAKKDMMAVWAEITKELNAVAARVVRGGGREGTLSIPGPPLVKMLGGVPSDVPMELGTRVSKLLPGETSPGWDDGIKTLEARD